MASSAAEKMPSLLGCGSIRCCRAGQCVPPPPLTPAAPALALPVKVFLAALAQKLLQQKDLQPSANGLGVAHPLRALALAVHHAGLRQRVHAGDPDQHLTPWTGTTAGQRATRPWRGAENYFQALFTLEMVLKVLAFAWLGRGPSGAWVGYLADP
jgi:hypothetical protein